MPGRDAYLDGLLGVLGEALPVVAALRLPLARKTKIQWTHPRSHRLSARRRRSYLPIFAKMTGFDLTVA
jgi:hypothetical protein